MSEANEMQSKTVKQYGALKVKLALATFFVIGLCEGVLLVGVFLSAQGGQWFGCTFPLLLMLVLWLPLVDIWKHYQTDVGAVNRLSGEKEMNNAESGGEVED